MNLNNLYLQIFSTTSFLNINLGFYISMSVVILIVIAMNIVFWSIKPKKDKSKNQDKK